MKWASANDIQLLTHANGERAMDLLIAAHRAAQSRYPKARDLRPVLIHGQFVREDQLDDFKILGVIPSLFQCTPSTGATGTCNIRLDQKRAEHLAHRMGTQAGMIFTSHHDAPLRFPIRCECWMQP